VRFGIKEMQMDMLIPPDLSPDKVMAHLASFDHAGLVRGLTSTGFSLIELGGDLVLFFPQSFSPQAIERLAALKQEQGLAYTVHLPLWSVEPSTLLTPVRQGSVRAVVECIRATLPLHPEVCVLHATGALAAEFYRMRTGAARALILRQFQNCARESLKAILGETGIASRQLAIETIEFPFNLTMELAEELDLSICLDTGHVLSGFSGPVELDDVIERCLPRLAEVHLHDSPRLAPGRPVVYGKDHQPLGAGDLDVGRLLDRLAAANFTGPLIFELRVEQALASLDVIRSLRPGALQN
jgi:sugar phosphate isomerase/epimerase